MQGNIYIFDKLGNYIKAMGGKGQGPGEFQSPKRIGIDSEDRVNVLDNRKLHLFDNKFEFIKTIPLDAAATFCCLTDCGNILSLGMEFGPEGLIFKIDILSPDGKITNEIDEVLISRENMGNPRAETNTDPMLYLSRLDNVRSIYGKSSEYRLYVLDSLGRIVRIIERDESQKKKLSFFGFLASEEGLIFVNRKGIEAKKGQPTSLDIFNAAGNYIYKAFTNGINAHIIRVGYLYSSVYDSEVGAFFIKRYKINNWNQIKEGS